MAFMRKPALLLYLVAVSAFAAPARQTLGARSAHHELRLDRSAAAEQIAYDVTVVDLDSGKTVLSSHVEGKPGQPLDVNGTAEGKEIRVHLADTPHFFSATVNVLDGTTILDEFRTWWQLEPHEAGSETHVMRGATPPPPPAIDGTVPLRVGGDVKAPVVIRRVEPVYTAEARQNRVSGIVIVEVVIDTTGRVRNVQILKPLPSGLDQAAVDAVKQWEFKPGTLNGSPVPVIFNLTVNFKLDDPPPPQP
jgi:TonB family protein